MNTRLNLAGVGVIFKLLSLLYENLGQQLPAKAYELLLLGTIADVVPLRGRKQFLGASLAAIG